MELQFENKIYKGVVISVRLAGIDSFGNSTHEFFFKGGKRVYYTQKTKLPMSVKIGDTMRFSGFFHKDKFIVDVLHNHYNEEKLSMLYGEEEKKKIIANRL